MRFGLPASPNVGWLHVSFSGGGHVIQMSVLARKLQSIDLMSNCLELLPDTVLAYGRIVGLACIISMRRPNLGFEASSTSTSKRLCVMFYAMAEFRNAAWLVEIRLRHEDQGPWRTRYNGMMLGSYMFLV